MTREADGGFLSRWSQRKQAARQQERTAGGDDLAGMEPAGAADADTTAQGDAALERPSQEETAAANQAAAESVDLETLGFESDYSVFLKDGVSTQLKNAALRRLWRSNPVLACLDGLNDYDEDFRKVETFAHGVRSSWQVGKGYGWMAETETDREGNVETTADANAETDAVAAAEDEARDPTGGDDHTEVAVASPDPEHEAVHQVEAAEQGEGADEGERTVMVADAPAHQSPAPEPARMVQAPQRAARRRVRFT